MFCEITLISPFLQLGASFEAFLTFVCVRALLCEFLLPLFPFSMPFLLVSMSFVIDMLEVFDVKLEALNIWHGCQMSRCVEGSDAPTSRKPDTGTLMYNTNM